MNVLLVRTGHLNAIPQGSIFQTVFHGVLMTVFPKEFHDPVSAESIESSKVK